MQRQIKRANEGAAIDRHHRITGQIELAAKTKVIASEQQLAAECTRRSHGQPEITGAVRCHPVGISRETRVTAAHSGERTQNKIGGKH